jgi:uncharacterized protein
MIWRFTAIILLCAAGAAFALPQQAHVVWQVVSGWVSPPSVPQTARFAEATPEGAALVVAAEAQVGVVRIYDAAYVGLDFPGGDVAADRGVCTDVLIRAMRVGLGVDLQLAMRRDMAQNFASYPALWGLSAPDPNIDHRRVPNLRHLLESVGASLPISADPRDFLPGDVVTSVLPDGQTHVVIVTHRASVDGERPLIVHNIGAGTRVEDGLFSYEITGHYRINAATLARLRALTAN